MTMLDDSQRQIVEIRSAYNLVLAPPGCGKTHLLAERIRALLDVHKPGRAGDAAANKAEVAERCQRAKS